MAADFTESIYGECEHCEHKIKKDKLLNFYSDLEYLYIQDKMLIFNLKYLKMT